MFDAKKFLDDYNIPYDTKGKNCSPGYINIQCPMCDDRSNHGGFNINQEFYNCWKCKTYSLGTVIKELLDISWPQVNLIIDEYTNNYSTVVKKVITKKPIKVFLPKGVIHPLPKRHKKYLRKRNFDPYRIEKEFDLYGTELLGSYCLRIIAPIYYGGKLISYQARDITGKQKLRYKTCEKDKEIIFHKDILYNQDNCKSRAVIVEGITDVWRLGKGACATFGTGWRQSQLLEMIKLFNHIFILYDKGVEAQKQAEKLGGAFSSFHNKTAEIIMLDYDDPASMPQNEANYLIKELNL
jgi:hypothetical protein